MLKSLNAALLKITVKLCLQQPEDAVWFQEAMVCLGEGRRRQTFSKPMK